MKHRNANAFGMRQLNPYRGVLQVFLGERARALSANGRVWEIQVCSDKPRGLWANVPFDEERFFTFGLWSADEGLHQVPINPLFNVRDMITSAEVLIENLRPAQQQLPFPLADPFEAWLLDEATSQPLALLQSSLDDTQRGDRETCKWIAAEQGDFGFVSSRLLSNGIDNLDDHSPRRHASLLEAMVQERAGQHARCLWYHRHKDGGGSLCDGEKAVLAAEGFPELPINEHWPASDQSALIADYIRWQAPLLLMLPGLRPETRDRLERLAVEQAEAVERLWRLYPEIHNRKLLNNARVKARIRTANRN